MASAALSDFVSALRAGSIDWTARPAAAPSDIARLSSRIPGAPGAYLEFLTDMDGGEGAFLTDAPITYVRLWSAAWSMKANDDYEIEKWLPGYWGIGDNGGGEVLAFDRPTSGWPLYVVPFMPMEAVARIPVAAGFSEMLPRLGKRAASATSSNERARP